jgi:hypothetical protein
VESTSQSKLVLTPWGRSVHQLGIASDGDWPSWLHVLSLFLDGGSDISKVMVVAPSKSMVNIFGLNRASDTVTWHKLNLSKAIHTSSRHKLQSVCGGTSLLLYSGSLPGFQSLMDILGFGTFPVLLSLPGHLLLHQLQTLPLSWKRLRHSDVGGASSSSTWIGYSFDLDPSMPAPTYCASAMQDLLEIAPKVVQSIGQPAPSGSMSRSAEILAHNSLPFTWLAHVLFPVHALQGVGLVAGACPKVLAPTPFSLTKWGSREFTAKEVGRMFDLPVDCEKHLSSMHKGTLTKEHALQHAIPVKLLCHALWLSNYCGNKEGVVELVLFTHITARLSLE